MGKPTGFMEYEREVSKAVKPGERIKNFNEFHEHLPAASGCAVYGVRGAVLPGRDGYLRHDVRVSAAQSGAGVE